jgi:hypothetical protein
MAVRPADAQALAAPTAAVGPSHVGGGPCLVDEDQMIGGQIELTVEPSLPAPQDVGPVLLAGMRRLFLRVMAWRAKKRRIVP